MNINDIINDIYEAERVWSMAEAIQKEIKKLGSPREVLPATILLICAQLEPGTTLSDFLKIIEKFCKDFNCFPNDLN